MSLLTRSTVLDYHKGVDTDLVPSSGTQSVDLTGLPGGVAQGIQQLVRALREGHAQVSAASVTVESRQDERSPLIISRPKPSAEEVDHLLDELSSGPPRKALPPDFSRADLYDDHD